MLTQLPTLTRQHGLLVDAIAYLLQQLGSTPDEVAALLRSRGIRGERHDRAFVNPVVRFLNRTLDIGARLEVDRSRTTLVILLEGRRTAIALPGPVQEFLQEFSDGRHPDLEQLPDISQR